MESLGQVKEALAARSELATLEQLEQRGRRSVNVIKADRVAEMIDTAVGDAISSSDLIPQHEADAQIQRASFELRELLSDRDRQIEQLRADLAVARDRLAHFEALIPASADQAASATNTAAAAAAAATHHQHMAPPAPRVEPAPGPDVAGSLASAVDQLSEAMSDRLDQMSKKLGISTAVEADEVSLDGLFHGDDMTEPTESNIDDLEVKQKTSGGIAANLERLKKLKGGD